MLVFVVTVSFSSFFLYLPRVRLLTSYAYFELRSFSVASAIPMVLKPVTLHCKDDHGNVVPFLGFGSCFADGSIKNDLPLQQLAEVFNVNYFIVSQCNPHIIPFFFHHRGSSGDPSRRGIGLGSRFRGGFISSMLEVALRLEMRKWLQVC